MVIGFDDMRDVLTDALETFYLPATLEIWETSGERNTTTGTFDKICIAKVDCLLQRDECSEAQRADAGYESRDVRLLVLQRGLARRPDTDSRIWLDGTGYAVMSLAEDAARTYFDIRARAADMTRAEMTPEC